ncbi:MAG: lysine exporter LysO family protein [Candidatus Thorarchaeota archaeon]
MNILLIIACLILGLVLGYSGRLPQLVYNATNRMTTAGLILLLAAMGAQVGANDTVMSSLATIGISALAIAVFTIIGSLILVKLFASLTSFEIKGGDDRLEEAGDERSVTILVVVSVVMGVLVGYFLIPDSLLGSLSQVTTCALAFLLFGFGMDIGRKREILQSTQSHLFFLGIPVLVAIGSIVGGIFAGFVLGMPLNESAAVGAGCGWYSLSGVIISEMYSVELGLLAFLSNLLRELIAILICPVVVSRLGKVASIAPGGATTMDIGLPIIRESAGEELVIPAFISGVVLTGLVPLLVPLLIGI